MKRARQPTAPAAAGRSSKRRGPTCGVPHVLLVLLLATSAAFLAFGLASRGGTAADDTRRLLALRHAQNKGGSSPEPREARLPGLVTLPRRKPVSHTAVTEPSSPAAAAALQLQPPPGAGATYSAAAPAIELDAFSDYPNTPEVITKLLARRVDRGDFHTSSREVPKAYKEKDEDVVLLLPGETDPYFGVTFRPPTSHVLPSEPELVRARRAHEQAAEVAVVVISSPRTTEIFRDTVQQHYFRLKADCHTAHVRGEDYRAPPCPSPADVAGCVAFLADVCDAAGDACMGFNLAGDLFHAVDYRSCSIDWDQPAKALGTKEAAIGMFVKSPPGPVVVPRPITLPSSDPALNSTWWFAYGMDVSGYGLGLVNCSDISGDVDASVLRLAAECDARPSCAGFVYPAEAPREFGKGYVGGELKATVHIAQITAPVYIADGYNAGLYSKTRLPPLDYLTATVVSFMEELGEACDGSGEGAGVDRGGFHGGNTHLYVFDTSRPEMQAFPGGDAAAANPRFTSRNPDSDAYWFASFAWLRRTYGSRPCVSFMSSTSYTRMAERELPAHGRGQPQWQADNRGRGLGRGNVRQTLDFVSGIRHAGAMSPAAHVLIWEDDCYACPGTLSYVERTASAISLFDPHWGALKVGNGGSGMLFHSDIVSSLITYMVTRRGSDNVDVAMWRFLHSGGYSDYLCKLTWSAHRGLTSSFRVGGQSWKRVECGNLLDFYWGWYRECEPRLVSAAMQVQLASDGIASSSSSQVEDEVRKAVLASGNVSTHPGLAAVMSEWRCSVWSGGAVPIMPS